jgi:hypothetical protein
MVVAEMAVAMPAVAIVLCLCGWALTVAGSQLRLEDAVRVVSRGAAMGLGDDVLLQRAMQVSPDITLAIDGDGVTSGGGLLRVTLSRPLKGPGLLPDLTLVATASTVREIE